MTTNELPLEKCIASRFPDDLGHPPVPSPETLASPDLDTASEVPPSTRLLLEGFDSEEITTDFLVGIHDLADEHGLPLESISVSR